MAFEIQEDTIALVVQTPYDGRAFGREQPAADLEAARDAPEGIRQPDRLGSALDVERD
jgi:hypothetical protein